MEKSKKNQTKAKLNLSVREEPRNKLDRMACFENRSVSNLIEVMANERCGSDWSSRRALLTLKPWRMR